MSGAKAIITSGLFGVFVALWLAAGGCGSNPSTVSAPSPGDTTGNPASAPETSPVPPTSVGDVVNNDYPGELTTDSPGVTSVRVTLSVRNDSAEEASVTVAFLRNGLQVDLAFATVRPGTITRIDSASLADRIDVTGVTASGAALPRRTFTRGPVAPDAWKPEYIIEATSAPHPSPPPPESSPIIRVLDPSSSIELAIGSTLTVRWIDDHTTSQSLITLWLRPAGATNRALWKQLSPSIAAALDGVNDQIDVVLEAESAGLYEVIAELTTDGETVSAAAPGRLRLIEHASNIAPKITILSPASPVAVLPSESLRVAWDDEDPDSDAAISIYLVGRLPSGESISFLIAPPRAEDPDGPEADSVTVRLSSILPGNYDLFAVITDGLLSGTSRGAQSVVVRDVGPNIAPSIMLYEPARPVQAPRDGSVYVAWHDSDPDSNALISLLLDPDPSGDPNGNEILLVSSIAEDPDGDGADALSIGFPPSIESGMYRVVATITDGRSQHHSFASGTLTIVDGDSLRPEMQVVWPLLDAYRLATEPIMFGAVFRNVDPDQIGSRYAMTATLSNGLVDLDLLGSAVKQRNGNAIVWSVNLSKVGIPNDTPKRRFNINLGLWENGQLLSQGAAPGQVLIYQDVILHGVQLVDVSCESRRNLSDGYLTWTWTGGGFESTPSGSGVVEFWLARDGIWPPPLPDHRQYRMILSTRSMPGIWVTQQISYADIDDMDTGNYVLVAVVDHPFVGQRVISQPDQPITTCTPATQGAGQEDESLPIP